MAKCFPISLAITVGHPAMIATGPIGVRDCGNRLGNYEYRRARGAVGARTARFQGSGREPSLGSGGLESAIRTSTKWFSGNESERSYRSIHAGGFWRMARF